MFSFRKNLKCLKKNKGYVTIYLILFLSIFIPILYFFSTEYPILISQDGQVKRMLDNASASAILELNENKLNEGVIYVDDKAKEVAYKVIKESFNLNDDLSITDKSFLYGKPTIKITIVNNPSSISTQNGDFNIKNPSIIIEGKFPVKSLFKKEVVELKHTSISQAQFRK